MESTPSTRRELLSLISAAALAGAGNAAPASTAGDPGPLRVCIFSKHFQWTDVHEAAALAADIGFDGMDLTVRAGGHVLPERAEQDLPRAVETVRKAGLEAPMITAGIVDATSPHTEAILRTANSLGIRQYRWGGFTYDYSKSISGQLDALKPRVQALAELNAKYNICAMYHTHSGPRQLGASIWDVWTVLREMDPRWVAINYDIGHATVEGGYGGWIDSAHLVQKYMRGVALKDFKWGQNGKGEWIPDWCAAGAGMVHFAGFFEILKAAKFSGPLQLHFEYPELGGANDGKTKIDISKDQVVAIMRRDLTYIKGLLRQARLA
jgi:sugar phosphate isomerase/epimerase